MKRSGISIAVGLFALMLLGTLTTSCLFGAGVYHGGEGVTIQEWKVAPKLVDYTPEGSDITEKYMEVTVGGSKMYLKPDAIEGFFYEAGYEYILEVEVYVNEIEADNRIVKYKLIKIKERKPVETDKEPS